MVLIKRSLAAATLSCLVLAGSLCCLLIRHQEIFCKAPTILSRVRMVAGVTFGTFSLGALVVSLVIIYVMAEDNPVVRRRLLENAQNHTNPELPPTPTGNAPLQERLRDRPELPPTPTGNAPPQERLLRGRPELPPPYEELPPPYEADRENSLFQPIYAKVAEFADSIQYELGKLLPNEVALSLNIGVERVPRTDLLEDLIRDRHNDIERVIRQKLASGACGGSLGFSLTSILSNNSMMQDGSGRTVGQAYADNLFRRKFVSVSVDRPVPSSGTILYTALIDATVRFLSTAFMAGERDTRARLERASTFFVCDPRFTFERSPPPYTQELALASTSTTPPDINILRF